MITSMLAVDATMEIVKSVKVIPKIMIKDDSIKPNRHLSKKIFNLLNTDLKISGHFNVKNNKKHNEIFEYTALEALGYNLFVKMDLQKIKKSIELSVELIDLNLNVSVSTKIYRVNSIKKYPFLAHQIAIDINAYINAPTIEWMNRFVVLSKTKNAKLSNIVIADYTLTYQQTIIQGGLNIFPKWADKNQEEIYYTSLQGSIPTLNKINIFTGKKQKIYQSSGMIVCSDVSEDGSKILVTMSPFDQPDIYMIDLKSGKTTRVTSYKGIDVNAQFIDDDTRVVFVSDRSITPNIFAKSLNGGGVEKLVDYGKNNSSCTTNNNYVIFSSKESNNEFGHNTFNLYMISTNTDYVRRLTANGTNQFPKFSSDGESVLYLKQYKNRSSLGILRLQENKSFLFPIKINNIQSIDW